MRKTFAYAPSPLIVGVVRERTAEDAVAAAKRCEENGATAIDLHLSCLEEGYKNEDALRSAFSAIDLPTLALEYSQGYDMSPIEQTEEKRTELLAAAARAGACAVDVQGYTFDLKSKTAFYGDRSTPFGSKMPKEVVTDEAVINRQKELFARIREAGAEVLLSTHTGVYLDTREAVALAGFLAERKPDIIKLVVPCENELELAESFVTAVTLRREVGVKVHFHASGKAGRLSRLVNPLIGGHLVFCRDGDGPNANAEQLLLSDAAQAIKYMKKCM